MQTHAVAAALCCLPMLAGAQTYTIRAVDTDVSIEMSWATGVTNGGRVVGSQVVEHGRRTFGFVWNNGSIEQLVVPQAGDFSVSPRMLDVHHHVEVLAMSEAGYYAGVGSNVNFGHSSQPYFAWLPSADPYPAEFVAAENVGNTFMHDITDTAPFVTAVGVGTFQVGTSFVRKGFISRLSKADDTGSPARMTTLNGFGGNLSSSAAFGVNLTGDVVGFASNATGFHRPFVRRAATSVMTDLGTLGGPSGEANAISDSGFIVGKADIATGQPHAFRRAPGTSPLTDLGTLGGNSSEAAAINNAGDTVGNSWTADGVVHAFLWSSGTMLDLNTLLPPASGWTLTHATGINDSGVIVGKGLFAGRTLAFILAPAACPSDFNNDGFVNGDDFDAFSAAFVAGDSSADFDKNGFVNGDDFDAFVARFVAGC